MSIPSTATATEGVVDHFFRHESGKVIAHLARVFGTAHIEVIEDAVQDALIKAMQTWPFGNVPSNPGGWIMRVAKNRVIDILRHDSRSSWIGEDNPLSNETEATGEVALDHEVRDDQLRMFFACCDSELSPESQVMLTLK